MTNPPFAKSAVLPSSEALQAVETNSHFSFWDAKLVPPSVEGFPSELLKYLKGRDLPNQVELEHFIADGGDLYSRQNEWGHLTGSAWIVNNDMTKVLLIKHGKYKIWVAPGGHVDPGETPYQAALREAEEEVGIKCDNAATWIFDVDIHRIPHSEKKNEPAHWHADVRYLVFGSEDMLINLNEDECDDVRWVDIADLLKADSMGIKRMASLTRIFADNLRLQADLERAFS